MSAPSPLVTAPACQCEGWGCRECNPNGLVAIPVSCWRPRDGTGIPADAQMYPPGCPDAEWCRGNRACFWGCKEDGLDD